MLEDDLLESVFEITDKPTSSLEGKFKYILSALLSFLGGGITFAFIRKVGILRG